MKQTIDHSDCLVNYWGDCIHSHQINKEEKYTYQPTCEVVEGCKGRVVVDEANERVCEAGHGQERPEIEEQYWKESQV